MPSSAQERIGGADRRFDHQATGNQRHIVFQVDDFGSSELESRLRHADWWLRVFEVNDRQLGAAQADVPGFVVLGGGADGEVGLDRVAGHDDVHAGQRGHQREVLDRLRGGAVLADRDAAVRGDQLDVHALLGDLDADLIEAVAGHEDGEGGGVDRSCRSRRAQRRC